MYSVFLKYQNATLAFLCTCLLSFSACVKEPPVVERGDPEILQGLLSNNRTLKNKYSAPDAPDYVVRGVYQVLYASLKIEAGVVIHFEEDAGLEIGEDAALYINGTGNNKVVLTGTVSTPGFWRGILIQSDVACSIAFAEVHYGGRAWWQGSPQSGIFMQAKLISSRKMSIDISDCLITNSPQFGIYLGETVEKAFLKRNVFKHHGRSPLVCPTYLIPDIDLIDSDYKENGHNGIFLINGPLVLDGLTYGAYSYSDQRIAQWKRLPEGGTYRGKINMKKLTLEAGTIIEIPPSETMSISEGLTAIGTSEQKIIFRNIPGKGNFFSLFLYGGAFPSTLEHCIISNGGNRGGVINIEFPANIHLWFGHKLFLTNSLVENSEGCGIFLEHNPFNTIQSEVIQSGSTFTNNTTGDICD